MIENTCKNCGESTQNNYCSYCGQSTHTCRVNLHHIIHEFLHGVVHVDKGFIYSIRELTIRPGKTIHDYFDGKRSKIFKPFGYFFILATAYVFLSHLLGSPILSTTNSKSTQDIKIEINNIHSDSHREFSIKLTEAVENIYYVMEHHYSLILLCTIPISAFATWTIFRKQKYNYGEHLVLNSYISGQQMLFSILLIPIMYLQTNNLSSQWWYYCLHLSIYIYMISSIFDKYKIGIRILYSILVCSMTMVIMWIIATAIITTLILI